MGVLFYLYADLCEEAIKWKYSFLTTPKTQNMQSMPKIKQENKMTKKTCTIVTYTYF